LRCLLNSLDKTLTLSIGNDYMTDNLGYGHEKRRQGNLDTLADKVTFRDSFRDMLDSVTKPFNECTQILVDNIKLDPYFAEFYQWSLENNIPVVVLSGGMEPIIHAILKNLVGPTADKIQVVGNYVGSRDGKDINTERGWEINYRHPESGFGHDKSVELRKYSSLPNDQRPTMFYAGGKHNCTNLSYDRLLTLLPQTVSQIFLLRGKLIFCSPSRATT
jgi:2-hydroxy-3-keto-5-methylthiopentenyl-1-phosphate phosphatase